MKDFQEIYSGLVLRFAGYNRMSGKVEKVVKSSCGRYASDKGRSKTINVEACPNDIFITTHLKEVCYFFLSFLYCLIYCWCFKMNVTWKEPKFSSKYGIQSVERNLKPGQVFTWGEYLVIYLAKDNVSFVECTFMVCLLLSYSLLSLY